MRVAALLILAIVVAGCGGGDESDEPLVIDERAGTFRGVGIGDSASDVQLVFGERDFAGPNEGLMPSGSDFTEDGGPWSVRAPAPCRARTRSATPMLRYDEVTFVLCDGRVHAFVVTDGAAETVTGIAIGDDLAEVRGTYGGFTCGETPETGEGNFDRDSSYPYCVGTAAPRRWVWFGEDPVRSITVAATSLDPRDTG
jgi:hypothetical protein